MNGGGDYKSDDFNMSVSPKKRHVTLADPAQANLKMQNFSAKWNKVRFLGLKFVILEKNVF